MASDFEPELLKFLSKLTTDEDKKHDAHTALVTRSKEWGEHAKFVVLRMLEMEAAMPENRRRPFDEIIRDAVPPPMILRADQASKKRGKQ